MDRTPSWRARVGPTWPAWRVERPPGTCRVGVISMWPMFTATGAAIANPMASAMSARLREFVAFDEALADLRGSRHAHGRRCRSRRGQGRSRSRAPACRRRRCAAGATACSRRPWWRDRSSCRRSCMRLRSTQMLTTWPRSRATMPGTTRRREVEHGAQVDVDQQVDVLGVGVQELPGPVDARVVHQDVEVDLARSAPRAPAQVGHVHGVGDAAGARRRAVLSASPLRASAWTSRPSRRRRSTTAAPMPEEAPVTRAVL